jgi:hypothetical protein
MEKSRGFCRLRNGAAPDGDLDSHERERMILKDKKLQTVFQGIMLQVGYVGCQAKSGSCGVEEENKRYKYFKQLDYRMLHH